MTTEPTPARRERYAAALRAVETGMDHASVIAAAETAMTVADAEHAELRKRHWDGLRRADEINNNLMEEVQRYAVGEERPVLWSVYNEMHKRALRAEAEAHQYRTALQGVARRAAVLPPPVSRADVIAEAIRRVEAERDATDVMVAEYPRYDLKERNAIGSVLRVLRRMADEAQPGTEGV